ncbi:hypothetical protein [Aureibacter tunicatorum]|uniref:Uncharacterized protein n=1 Tax=Aureibacter tunicatorum TaxID=866807 RepID=A0AAE3XL13_9BACT|nr:hypothetical protein [Aureibacter tunicatorum]MDR6237706.1 hypothetical protein [Aureibacter tunicatorum]BDD02741.1 hypothetical protein AUTU_02240 [Aureibacter tunicatorum]
MNLIRVFLFSIFAIFLSTFEVKAQEANLGKNDFLSIVRSNIDSASCQSPDVYRCIGIETKESCLETVHQVLDECSRVVPASVNLRFKAMVLEDLYVCMLQSFSDKLGVTIDEIEKCSFGDSLNESVKNE